MNNLTEDNFILEKYKFGEVVFPAIAYCKDGYILTDDRLRCYGVKYYNLIYGVGEGGFDVLDTFWVTEQNLSEGTMDGEKIDWYLTYLNQNEDSSLN